VFVKYFKEKKSSF